MNKNLLTLECSSYAVISHLYDVSYKCTALMKCQSCTAVLCSKVNVLRMWQESKGNYGLRIKDSLFWPALGTQCDCSSLLGFKQSQQSSLPLHLSHLTYTLLSIQHPQPSPHSPVCVSVHERECAHILRSEIKVLTNHQLAVKYVCPHRKPFTQYGTFPLCFEPSQLPLSLLHSSKPTLDLSPSCMAHRESGQSALCAPLAN